MAFYSSINSTVDVDEIDLVKMFNNMEYQCISINYEKIPIMFLLLCNWPNRQDKALCGLSRHCQSPNGGI